MLHGSPSSVADPLRAQDLEVSRRDSPAQKLAQALELMESAIRLKRAALQNQLGPLTDEQLDRELARWLSAEG